MSINAVKGLEIGAECALESSSADKLATASNPIYGAEINSFLGSAGGTGPEVSSVA